jgi:carbamoyltransferase
LVKRDVIVLGINDGHDAGAALVKNGQVVAAVHEERLNNIKHFTGVPEKSSSEVFRIAKVHPSEVNLISLASVVDDSIYFKPKMYGFKTKALIQLGLTLHSDRFLQFCINYVKKYRTFKELKDIFAKLDLSDTEIAIVEHHTAHAAAAYRSSPWGYDSQDTLILTADGSGDGLSSTVNIAKNGSIERIAFSSLYHSIGNAFYSEITRFLGLKPWDHESKVMGLAPYGKAGYCIEEIRKMIRIHPNKPLSFQNTTGSIAAKVQPKLKKLLVNQRFDNIAAAAQQHLDDLMKKWVENAIQATSINRIACAGGIFLNVKTNKTLREMDLIDDVFFYPAPDDEGLPVGAALQGYYEYCKRDGIQWEYAPIGETYYGSSYSDEEIKQMLNNSSSKFKYDYYDDIDGIAGELLCNGKILARFNGRGEWGPRALGNRSILADPRDMQVIHKINFAIKQRDFWMPFAPSLLEERKDDYLVNSEFAPYMILSFDSTEEGDKIPATIHPYDRTCRPQTVRSEWNPNYYKIIKTFESATGIGAVLNTSFNLHGYPMVGTPETALWTFENSKLDALAIGNYLVTKNSTQ